MGELCSELRSKENDDGSKLTLPRRSSRSLLPSLLLRSRLVGSSLPPLSSLGGFGDLGVEFLVLEAGVLVRFENLEGEGERQRRSAFLSKAWNGKTKGLKTRTNLLELVELRFGLVGKLVGSSLRRRKRGTVRAGQFEVREGGRIESENERTERTLARISENRLKTFSS